MLITFLFAGVLQVPVTMTVVVRETQIDGEEFDRSSYLSFVANEEQLEHMGHSAEDFALTNKPLTVQIVFKLDQNWRLESEQRRVSNA